MALQNALGTQTRLTDRADYPNLKVLGQVMPLQVKLPRETTIAAVANEGTFLVGHWFLGVFVALMSVEVKLSLESSRATAAGKRSYVAGTRFHR